MQQDACMRAAARVIYDEVYPSEEWAPVTFEEAERLRTVHYRQAVSAAQAVRPYLLPDNATQLPLI